MGINIQKITSTSNTTACAKRTPKYLVLHYTASTRSNSDQAKAIAKMFADPSRQASADYIVDDKNIVQYNPDPTTRYCWAVGGSKYSVKYCSECGRLYGVAKNSNCISIEMTSSKKNSKSLNFADKDWSFSDKVLENTLELCVYLMKLYNIGIDNVILHASVTGKPCPAVWANSESALSGYKEFKAKLKSKLSGTTTTTTTKKAYSGAYPSGAIKLNSSGDEVKKLQKYLNWYGSYKLTEDGKAGSKTVEAIKKFQKAEKLTTDGIWGSKCLSAAKAVKK